MIKKSELNWLTHYVALKGYVEKHRQLPDKKKEEGRALLNWWKYQKKLMKQGKIPSERQELLKLLSEMRTVKRLFTNS